MPIHPTCCPVRLQYWWRRAAAAHDQYRQIMHGRKLAACSLLLVVLCVLNRCMFPVLGVRILQSSSLQHPVQHGMSQSIRQQSACVQQVVFQMYGSTSMDRWPVSHLQVFILSVPECTQLLLHLRGIRGTAWSRQGDSHEQPASPGVQVGGYVLKALSRPVAFMQRVYRVRRSRQSCLLMAQLYFLQVIHGAVDGYTCAVSVDVSASELDTTHARLVPTLPTWPSSSQRLAHALPRASQQIPVRPLLPTSRRDPCPPHPPPPGSLPSRTLGPPGWRPPPPPPTCMALQLLPAHLSCQHWLSLFYICFSGTG